MAAAQKKILVVEDEKDVRELVRYNLEQEGFRVLEAEDGEFALALVRRERPALVILDIMLPGMNGLDVCRELRAGERTREIPIIMITAKSEETDQVVGYSMGADDYVPKPFSNKVLLHKVKALLRRVEGRGSGDELDRLGGAGEEQHDGEQGEGEAVGEVGDDVGPAGGRDGEEGAVHCQRNSEGEDDRSHGARTA